MRRHHHNSATKVKVKFSSRFFAKRVKAHIPAVWVMVSLFCSLLLAAFDTSVALAAPIYTSSPTPPGGIFDVGASAVGTPVSASLSITNTGDANLVVNLGSITGPQAGEFLVTTPTPLTIAPGATSPISIQCTPLGAGLRQATLTLNNSPPATPATVTYNLQCTGQVPIYNSAPAPGSTINVGSANVGSPVTTTFTVSNTGNGTLFIYGAVISGTNNGDFNVQSPGIPFTVGAGGTVTVTLQCIPSAAGPRTASLRFNTNDPVTPIPTYNLTCTGQVPIYSSAPAPGSTINIGSSNVGVPVTLNPALTIQNIGTGTLTVSNPTITGVNAADFTVLTAFPLNITPGPGQGVAIRCTPGAGGLRTATLTFTTNDPVTPNPSYTLNCTGQVPIYSSAPPPGSTINIGNSLIGVPVTLNPALTIQNIGGGTLTVSNPTITGANAADFAVLTAFPLNITPGPGQGVAIRCTPSGFGLRTATLTFTTNDPVTPNPSYTLNCTGQSPIYTSAPPPSSTINIGNSTIGTPVVLNPALTITNTGTATLTVSNPTITGANAADFVVTTAFPLNLAGGASQAVAIQCTPSGSGLRVATLTFTTNDPVTPSPSYTLNCTGQVPTYSSTPIPGSTLNIGTSPVGTPVTATGVFIFQNIGAGTLTVSNPTITGANAADFTVLTAFPVNLMVGPTQSVDIRCTPGAGGLRTATLTLNTNDPVRPTVTYTLNCTGQAPIYSSAPIPGSTINIGSSNVGVPVTLNPALTITNAGTATLTVSNPTITGANAADFAVVTAFPINLAGGASQPVEIQCTPSGGGPRTATLTLTTNDTARITVTYTLTCTGTAPGYASTPVAPGGTITFVPPTNVGFTVNFNLTVQNVGVGVLNILSGTITGPNAADFSIANPLIPFSVNGGASRVVTLQCQPSAGGLRTATLTFTTNDPGNATVNYTLNCNGLAPIYTSAPVGAGGIINVGSATVGSSTTFNLTVGNAPAASLNLTVSTPIITGLNAGDFSISAAPATFPLNLAPNTTQLVVITCIPTGTGVRNATLTFATNDPALSAPSYSLVCTGFAPGYSSSPVGAGGTISVGSSTIGTPVTTNLTISNTGTASLTVSTAVITGLNAADFAVSTAGGFPFTIIVGGAAQTVTIQCTPSAGGLRIATLTFTTNDPSQPSPSYTLNCTGLIPGYNSTPVGPGGTINVGSAPIGVATPNYTLNVLNTGGASLTINSFAITGVNAADFVVTAPTFPFTIAAGGAARPVTLVCTPSGIGARTATLTFSTTDPAQPSPSYTLNCSGLIAGYTSAPAAPGELISIGKAKIGASLTYDLRVSNTGAAALTVSLPGGGAITGPQASSFSLLAPNFPFTLAPGGSIIVTIQCTVTKRDSLVATLTFNTTDPNRTTVSYSLLCEELKPEPKLPADLFLELTVKPDRVVSNNPENLIAYTFKITNRGEGPADAVRLLMPIDPALRVGYTIFEDPQVWVSELTPTTIKIAMPLIKPGRSVTGTIVFRPVISPKPEAGMKVYTRYSVIYDDQTGTNWQRFSNSVNFIFSDDDTNISTEDQQLLMPARQSGKVGSSFTYGTNFLAPEEFATAWITNVATRTSVQINGGWANRQGELTLVVTTNGFAPGEYTVSVRGNRSKVIGNASLTLTAPTLNPEFMKVSAGNTATFVANYLTAGEMTSAWMTDGDNKSTSLSVTTANAKGEFILTVNSAGMKPGTYTVVIRGNTSELSATASFLITEASNNTLSPIVPAAPAIGTPESETQPSGGKLAQGNPGTPVAVAPSPTSEDTSTQQPNKPGNSATGTISGTPGKVGVIPAPVVSGDPAKTNPVAVGNPTGESVGNGKAEVKPVAVNPNPGDAKAEAPANPVATGSEKTEVKPAPVAPTNTATLAGGKAASTTTTTSSVPPPPPLPVVKKTSQILLGSVKAGASLSGRATNFAAGEAVTIRINGNGKAVSLTASANANGEVSFSFDTGGLGAGGYTITVLGGTSQSSGNAGVSLS